MTYCSKCGKLVDDGSAFCPNCGAAMAGKTENQGTWTGNTENQGTWINNYGPNTGQQQNAPQGLGGTLTIILVLGVIWAIGSLAYGILYMLGGSFLLFFPVAGGVLIGVGVVYFIGGLFALLSCYYIFKQEKHNDAYILCLISSIIALFTGYVFVGIIGILFAFLLKKEKYRFKS